MFTTETLRPRGLLILAISVSLCLCGELFSQQTTTVTGTLINPDGSKSNGTMSVRTNSAFQSADGYQVKAGTVATATILNGYFTIKLVPNVGAAPNGGSYQVSFSIAGQRAVETWIVPVSASPVAWSQVYQAAAPPASYAVGFASLIAPKDCLILGGVPVLGANGWTCGSSGLGANAPLTVTDGAISLPQASGTQNGYLSSIDWLKFNTGASLAFTPPLQNVAGTIAMAAATGSQDGYLAAVDWLRFNSGASLNFTAPLHNLSGTIACDTASSSRIGCLAPADWATFAGKQQALGFSPENSANKNQPSGYAGLDASGLFPYGQLGGTVPTWNQDTTGKAAIAAALAAVPSACTPGAQYAYGVDASGNALCSSVGVAARSVTGASDTVVAADNGEQINCNYAPGCAEALPTATTLGVTGFQVVFLASAGASAVTPITWPVYPGGIAALSVASLAVPAGYACSFSVDPGGAAWDASCHNALVNNSLTVSAAPSSPGNFTLSHGLGRAPIEAIITMTSSGAIWCQVTCFDGTNLYLTASDAGLTAAVRVK